CSTASSGPGTDSSAARWWTSSTCSGGRCSTSPTWRSPWVASSWWSDPCGPPAGRTSWSEAVSGPLVELIPEALDGERVDRVVSLLAGCSRSDAAALVTAGAVTLDERVVGAGKQRVQAGQTLSVDVGQ